MAAETPLAPGRFIRPDGLALSRQELLRRAREADYILVGERHDSAGDHIAEAALLRLLAEDGQLPALGLEMLPRKRYNAVLHDFSAGRLPLDELPAALDWERNWGFSFSLYQPVFDLARRHALPIYGLNIAHDLRAKAARAGVASLSPWEKAELPARIIPPPPEQREKLVDVFLLHQAMRNARRRGGKDPGENPQTGEGGVASATGRRLVLPLTLRGVKEGRPADVVLPLSVQKPFERFLWTQSLWDSAMAEEARHVHRLEQRIHAQRTPQDKIGPLVILAGGGHVEYGYGIASRLSLLDPGSRILSVLPFSGKIPDPRSADLFYEKPAAAPSLTERAPDGVHAARED